MARLTRRENEAAVVQIAQTDELAISGRSILFEVAVEPVWSTIDRAPVAAVWYRATEELAHNCDAMKRLMRKHSDVKSIPTPVLHVRTESATQVAERTAKGLAHDVVTAFVLWRVDVVTPWTCRILQRSSQKTAYVIESFFVAAQQTKAQIVSG